ncbi:DNA/RNA helicase domain-containing protein [Amycolatopsis thailandensis]|uniref:DNA/RNA helicase domain-containing protein n=1 Tax=Amycolatopsis thailandensis TaxID=589330 RepID=UPI0037AF1308
MFVYGGSVTEAADAIEVSVVQFVKVAEARFTRLYRRQLSDSERSSWENSWPALLRTLTEAGLGDLRLFLEYELPGSGQRVDALLLGSRADGGMTAVVIELKQWTELDSTTALFSWVRRVKYLHPSRQAAGYRSYLDDWIDEPELRLETRAVAYLHDACDDVASPLRDAVANSPGSSEVSLLGCDDVRTSPSQAELAKMFGADDLQEPTEEQVQRFLTARHRPSGNLLTRIDDLLARDSVFRLVGAQQDTYLEVLDAVRRARSDPRKQLIVVSGGPGTGKTVIAARLVADIRKVVGGEVYGCYLTPSGTLHHQLKRAVTTPGADGLFGHVDNFVKHAGNAVVPIVDEAQRLRRNKRQVERMLARTRVCVLFLDERQVVRPGEGFTFAELEHQAAQTGAKVTHVKLVSQFRCNGSQQYLGWLEQLLYGEATPWTPSDYDLAISPTPAALSDWAERQNRAGHTTRITAGFCWQWTKDPDDDGELAKDVKLPWGSPFPDWAMPWNAFQELRDDEGPVPKTHFWATDDGGGRQVGCIYTAQGLEYDYGAVILGPDLVRRGNSWVATPETNEDPGIPRDIDPDHYLRLAANTYWVLATRASLGCRLYSADPETQEFLTSLVTPPEGTS